MGDATRRGVAWLLGTAGNEASMDRRVLLGIGRVLGAVKDDRDLSMKGWPWKAGTASWVEPTSHALVALKQAALKQSRMESSELQDTGAAGRRNANGRKSQRRRMELREPDRTRGRLAVVSGDHGDRADGLAGALADLGRVVRPGEADAGARLRRRWRGRG